MITFFSSAMLCVTSAQSARPAANVDWVIPTGIWVAHVGPEVVEVHDMIIEDGAMLLLRYGAPLHVRASGVIRIHGTVHASGMDARDVSQFNVPGHVEHGGAAGSGGNAGGDGNPIHWDPCPAGSGGGYIDGVSPTPATPRNGGGGESGVAYSSPGAAGGGGGVFAANQPVHTDPNHPSNIGRIARAGQDGAATAIGAISLLHPPAGGTVGRSWFVDSNPDNDFFGSRFDSITQTWITGELTTPRGGAGGGGGGNAIRAHTFPPSTPSPIKYVGAGGGGGGGLVILAGLRIELGPNGRILCDGGKGGTAENTNGTNRKGGGGGGGSGGMVILQARRVDLAHASPRAISALGGEGGDGTGTEVGGGNGGPGLIQIHVPDATNDLVLPAGSILARITMPTAHVLLPISNL